MIPSRYRGIEKTQKEINAVLEQIRAEIAGLRNDVNVIMYNLAVDDVLEIIDKYAEQEPISVSVSEKEPDEISEEVTLRFFRNTLKVRWQDLVIYNVEWLKKNWQMEMDIVCGVKPSEDAISRQAVLDELNKWDWQELYLPIHFKENIIDVVPSVRPQDSTDTKLMLMEANINGYAQGLKDSTKAEQEPKDEWQNGYDMAWEEAEVFYEKEEPKSPCDLCRYNPPSSADGKPCTMCPTEKGGE